MDSDRPSCHHQGRPKPTDKSLVHSKMITIILSCPLVEAVEKDKSPAGATMVTVFKGGSLCTKQDSKICVVLGNGWRERQTEPNCSCWQEGVRAWGPLQPVQKCQTFRLVVLLLATPVHVGQLLETVPPVVQVIVVLVSVFTGVERAQGGSL